MSGEKMASEILTTANQSRTATNGSTMLNVPSTAVKTFHQRKDTGLTILLSIGDTCLTSVIGDRKPKIVWDKLKAIYRSKLEESVDKYLSKYQKLNIEGSKTEISYVNRLRQLKSNIAKIGNPSNDKKCRDLLCGLENEFSVTVEVIRPTEKSILESISLVVVQERTISKKENKGETTDSAFIV